MADTYRAHLRGKYPAQADLLGNPAAWRTHRQWLADQSPC